MIDELAQRRRQTKLDMLREEAFAVISKNLIVLMEAEGGDIDSFAECKARAAKLLREIANRLDGN